MSARVTAARSCSGCDMCCTTLSVRELGKPAWQPCALLLGERKGCSVWGAHPPSCQAYHCLWRRSEALLPPGLFPPACGFLVTMEDTDHWPGLVNVCVSETGVRRWDTARNRSIFARLAAAWNCPVAIVDADTRASHVFAPMGGFYARRERPELFPDDGRRLALPLSDYGDDRRSPRERIAEAAFNWRA